MEIKADAGQQAQFGMFKPKQANIMVYVRAPLDNNDIMPLAELKNKHPNLTKDEITAYYLIHFMHKAKELNNANMRDNDTHSRDYITSKNIKITERIRAFFRRDKIENNFSAIVCLNATKYQQEQQKSEFSNKGLNQRTKHIDDELYNWSNATGEIFLPQSESILGEE